MTDMAYAVRISRATDLDQVEDFITALERCGAGNGNDIGRMKKTNHFPAGAVVVLFTADRAPIES
jgi:hypothetical protein